MVGFLSQYLQKRHKFLVYGSIPVIALTAYVSFREIGNSNEIRKLKEEQVLTNKIDMNEIDRRLDRIENLTTELHDGLKDIIRNEGEYRKLKAGTR